MNPFTRFLRSLSPRTQTPEIEEFILRWDVVEVVVVSVYKDRLLTPEVRSAYAEARAWLRQHAPHWRAWFAPYWPQTLQGGRPTPADPFEFILSRAGHADDFAEDWEAMQALAAAREALNRYLLALQSRHRSGNGRR
ncbi:MAG: hypothetical protein M5U01_21045 [Ardenticatenaceae bacterium]|nr:hypothetical protein [Ardenticatenaceae bacterium]